MAIENQPPFKQGPPINARGDRFLIPGEPGVLEEMVQMRQRDAIAQAEERILGYLEGIPGLLELITREQREGLVAMIRSISAETAEAYAGRLTAWMTLTQDYVPCLEDVPDPRDLGSLTKKIGDQGRPHDPLPVECPDKEADDEADPHPPTGQSGQMAP